MGDPGGGASAPVDAPRVKRRKIQGDDGTGGGETVVLRPASKASSGIPASTATVRDGEARRKSTEESHDVPTDGETADKFEKMATEDSEKQLDASRTQEYASTGIEPGPQSNDDAMSGDIDKAEPPASKPASRPRKRTQRPPKPPPRPRSPPPPDFRPALRLTGHTGPVAQVRLSPDGRFIASASADGTARLWDSRTGEHIETLVGHLAGVSALAWSPDSATLATGSDDKTIRLWDRVTGRPRGARIRRGALRAGGPTDAAAAEEDEDGGTTGGNDEGGDEWMGPGPPPTGLVVGADGGAEDGGGDAVGGTGIAAAGAYQGAVLRGHHNYVYCVAFSPKGNILASGSYDEAVFLWDVRAGRLMRSLPAHSDPVSGIDFSADGTLVVSCSTDGLTRIWDTMTGQCLRTLVHEDNPPVTSVCFSPNGRYVLAFSLDSCVRLWDYIEGKGSVRRTYQGHRNERFSIGGCFGFTVAPSTSSAALPGVPMTRAYIAGPSEDGSVVLWDVRTKEILQRIEGLFPAGNASANSGKSSGAGADGAGGSVCFWVDVHGSTMVAAGQDGSIVLLRDRNATKGRRKKGKDGDKEADGEETTAVGSRAGRLDDLAAGLDGINLAAHMDDPTVAAVFA